MSFIEKKTLMSKLNRGKQFLSGFGTENYLEDFFLEPLSNNPPAVNIAESEKILTIELGLPGYNSKNLEVSVNGNYLIIAGKEDKDTAKHDYVRQDFSYAAFGKSIRLPDYIDKENISAKYKDGILIIDLPKKANSKSRVSKIKVY